MFEKESNGMSDSERTDFVITLRRKMCLENGKVTDADLYFQGVKNGYHKAEEELKKEWYCVKDKLPPSGETVLLYYGVDVMGKAVVSTGCIDCKGNWYKNIDSEPIKWQEITLP